MAYLILVAIGLAAWHLVWEGVLAPAMRLNVRYRLFALRDEFRRQLRRRGSEIDRQAASFLQDALNTRIAYMDRLQLDTIYSAVLAYQNDQAFRAKVEHRHEVMRSDDTTRELAGRMNQISDDAVVANMGGWFVYLVPVLLAFVAGQKLVRTVNAVLNAPERDVQEHLPRLATAHSSAAA